jgi:hypothetical protein
MKPSNSQSRRRRKPTRKKMFEGMNIIEIWQCIVIHGISKKDVDFEKHKSEEIIARIKDTNSKEITMERTESL